MEERSQAELRAAYSQALAALRSGRAATAERQLRDTRARAPGDVNSLRLLRVALLDQDKVPAVVEMLERAVAAAPQFFLRAPIWRGPTEAGRPAAGGARGTGSGSSRLRPRCKPRGWPGGDVLVDLEKDADARMAYERARLD